LDRQKERRKRELQRQIDMLQAEVMALENTASTSSGAGVEQKNSSDDRFIKRGMLTLDMHTRRVMMNERVINLPPTSFDYLLVLARHTPNIVDYQTLVSEAQGYEADMREAQELTKWHIHHIRQAIEPDKRRPVHVINVRGAGYRLVV